MAYPDSSQDVQPRANVARESDAPSAVEAATSRLLAALDALEAPATTATMAPAPPPVPRRSMMTPRRWWMTGGVLALLVIGAIVVALPRARATPPKMQMEMPVMAMSAAKNSIAVLPFENVSHDTTAEYFAEGMADELTTALGHIPGLRVAARSSAGSCGTVSACRSTMQKMQS